MISKWAVLFVLFLQVHAYACESILIHSGNLIGIFSYPQDRDVENVKIIYKVKEENGRNQITLQLLKSDAQGLKKKVRSLLVNEVGSSIHLQAERLSDGSCFNHL